MTSTSRRTAAAGGLPGAPTAGIIHGRARRRALAPALVAAALQFAVWNAAVAEEPPENGNTVRVTADQMHQLGIVKVKPFKFSLQKPAIGQIAFNEDASTVVATPFSGRVTRLLAKIGDDVKRGDPLFEIDSPEVLQAQTDLIAAVQAAQKSKSQVALAKRVLDRQSGLITSKATSQRELDQAQTDHEAAQSDLKTSEGALTAARNRLRVIIGRDEAEVERVERERLLNPLITVNAPIDGTVIARKVGPGQYVRSDAGDALYSVVDLSTMWLKANVAEVDIPLVRVGQEVEVMVTALPRRVFKARVTSVGASSDAATRRVVVRSEIPNPDRSLKSEMFASFKISVGEGEQASAVPVAAVIWEGEVAVVWVEREPMLLERRRVKVGQEQDGHLQVLDGLKPGDLVVARGAIFVDNQWRQ